MSDEDVLIAGGTVKAALDFARDHRVELGIEHARQVIPVTDEAQLYARHGQQLIILDDCFWRAPRATELFMAARHGGLEIVRRTCYGERSAW